ncbi:MAG: hypothetical protein KJ621_02245 [Proteobacteria bacterium]|nr:hypothetical protein [Pseudomonadota bacterium]MBU1740825.1 hypothetical protein [Pseudomonadota bacterium]
MYPLERGQQVSQRRLQCRNCGDVLEVRDDSPEILFCSCGKVGLGGDPMAPTITGDSKDYEDLSKVRNFQVR